MPVPQLTVLSGPIDLPRLLDLCAQRLKVAIEYDPSTLKAQSITIRSAGGLSDAQLWSTTNQLLAQRGFTTVRQPGTAGFTVVKLDEAPRLARIEPVMELAAVAVMPSAGVSAPPVPETPASNNAAPVPAEAAVTTSGVPVAGYRLQPVRLAHLSAKDAAEAVKSMRGGGAGANAQAGAGSVSPFGPEGVILIPDLSARIDDTLAALSALDKPENATAVVELAVRNTAPAQLAVLVTQVAAKRDLVAGEKLAGEVLVAQSGSGLLVIAPRRNIDAWKSLVTQLDQREGVETATYTPRFFAVKEVAALMQQVVGAPGAGAGVNDAIKVVVEEPTGTLLVTATPSQHEKIRQLLARLESVPGEERRPVRTFVVRNRSVSELLEVLQKLIAAGVLSVEGDSTRAGATNIPAGDRPVGSSGSSSPGGLLGTGVSGTGTTPSAVSTNLAPLTTTATAPASSSTGATSGSRGLFPSSPGVKTISGSASGLPITLTADEATSTIIAVGDARLLGQLETLIKSLDVRQPQVMLDVILLTLSDSDVVDLGVELERLRVDGNTITRLSSLFGLSSPATIAGGAARQISEGNGFNGAVLNPGDFSVVVRALQTLQNGRSLSLPRVLVSNNQTATFNAVTQVPFSAAFTAGTNATTQTFGGTQDAGTQLTIKPQIGEGETLLLDYSIGLSSFTGPASNNLPPPRQVNNVKSIATIPDGYTAVVGGLEALSEGDSAKQVPGLGSVPVIGELFKSQSRSNSRSRFFVFIKASVLRGPSLEGLKYMSDQQRTNADLPDDWPRETAKVIR